MRKKIAIIGGGFSGLGLCYHLLKQKKHQITIFDPKDVGEGVSGMASGLLHPYPGESARASWRGKEAMGETRLLLDVAEEALGKRVKREEGILRFAVSQKQEKAFLKRAEDEEDVEWWDAEACRKEVSGVHYTPGIFIRSGICVHSRSYLQGLWKVCKGFGAEWIKEEVELDALKEYDEVVIAAGAGIRKFKECKHLAVKYNKGQILLCEKPHYFQPAFSLIGKGYVAHSEKEGMCTLGSTYEYNFLTEKPCLGAAADQIFSQIGQFLPSYSAFKVVDCFSGVRVSKMQGYLPVAGRLKENLWVLTAMGSRGLLYHAYLGKMLAEALSAGDENVLPEEVRI